VITAAGGPSPFDIRSYQVPEPTGYERWLRRQDVRAALFTPSHKWSSTGGLVASYLAGDVMRATIWRMPKVLSRLRVMVYNGQYDFICNVSIFFHFF